MCVYVRLGSYKCVFARSHRRAARSAPGPGSSLSSSHYTFLFSFFFESVVFVALVCSRLALPLNDRAMTMTMLRFTCLIIIDSGGPPETIGHTAVIVPRLRHRQLEKWDLLEISLRWWCDGRRWLAGSHSTGNAIQSTDAVTFWSVGLVGCECYGSSPRCLLVVIAGILIFMLHQKMVRLNFPHDLADVRVLVGMHDRIAKRAGVSSHYAIGDWTRRGLYSVDVESSNSCIARSWIMGNRLISRRVIAKKFTFNVIHNKIAKNHVHILINYHIKSRLFHEFVYVSPPTHRLITKLISFTSLRRHLWASVASFSLAVPAFGRCFFDVPQQASFLSRQHVVTISPSSECQ